MGTQSFLSMLGSAVSSSTPKDFHPNSHMGQAGSRPQISRHAMPAPPGRAYDAVGMHSTVDSAIGLPNRSSSALWMLVFVMPAEVRRYFTVPSPCGYRAPMSRNAIGDTLRLTPLAR